MLTAPTIASAIATFEPAETAATEVDDSARAELDRMIGEAAYYIAEQRGFEPGHELDDWLAAEAQIHDQLAASRGLAEPNARFAPVTAFAEEMAFSRQTPRVP